MRVVIKSMTNSILVVEDDRVLVSVVATALRQQGWEVQQAHNCACASLLAEKFHPDLLLLDLGLPDGDGWDLLNELRSGPLSDHIPVVVMTSRPVTRSELRQHEVDTFIPKPFGVGQLVSTVRTLFEREGGQKGGSRC